MLHTEVHGVHASGKMQMFSENCSNLLDYVLWPSRSVLLWLHVNFWFIFVFSMCFRSTTFPAASMVWHVTVLKPFHFLMSQIYWLTLRPVGHVFCFLKLTLSVWTREEKPSLNALALTEKCCMVSVGGIQMQFSKTKVSIKLCVIEVVSSPESPKIKSISSFIQQCSKTAWKAMQGASTEPSPPQRILSILTSISWLFFIRNLLMMMMFTHFYLSSPAA